MGNGHYGPVSRQFLRSLTTRSPKVMHHWNPAVDVFLARVGVLGVLGLSLIVFYFCVRSRTDCDS
jgi:hypothetical protein